MSISSVNGINEGKNASAENEVCKCHGGHCSGIIRVIGIGPGHQEEMTPKAIKALEDSDIIVGYNTYIALSVHCLYTYYKPIRIFFSENTSMDHDHIAWFEARYNIYISIIDNTTYS